MTPWGSVSILLRLRVPEVARRLVVHVRQWPPRTRRHREVSVAVEHERPAWVAGIVVHSERERRLGLPRARRREMLKGRIRNVSGDALGVERRRLVRPMHARIVPGLELGMRLGSNLRTWGGWPPDLQNVLESPLTLAFVPRRKLARRYLVMHFGFEIGHAPRYHEPLDEASALTASLRRGTVSWAYCPLGDLCLYCTRCPSPLASTPKVPSCADASRSIGTSSSRCPPRPMASQRGPTTSSFPLGSSPPSETKPTAASYGLLGSTSTRRRWRRARSVPSCPSSKPSPGRPSRARRRRRDGASGSCSSACRPKRSMRPPSETSALAFRALRRGRPTCPARASSPWPVRASAGSCRRADPSRFSMLPRPRPGSKRPRPILSGTASASRTSPRRGRS